MERTRLKRSLAFFISILMVVQTLVPIFVFAETETQVEPNIETYEELFEDVTPVEDTATDEEAEMPSEEAEEIFKEVFEEVKDETLNEVEEEQTEGETEAEPEVDAKPEVEEKEVIEKVEDELEKNREEVDVEKVDNENLITPRSIIAPVVNTKTFKFHVEGDLVAGKNGTQIVKDGEMLIEPESPSLPNKRFLGWFEGDTEIDFSIPVDVTQAEPAVNTNVIVNAKFSDEKLNVRFINNGVLVAVKEVNPGSTVSPSGVPAVVLEEGKVFSHWSLEPEGVVAFNFSTPITEDTNLYLVTKSQYRVIFASNGGSYVEEQHITNGNSAVAPPNPVRQGYNFLRWSLSESGAAYDFNSPVTSDLELHAVWEPRIDTRYTVVHWQQNAEDDEYVVADTEAKTGTTGTTANYAQKTYIGFSFKQADDKTIAADGTTVVNVYYDRNVHTFTIERNTGWNNWVNVSVTNYRYGQSTAGAYNAAVAAYPNHRWLISRTSSTSYSEAPKMPNNDLTVSGKYSGTEEYIIRYHERGTNPPVKVKPDYTFKAVSGLTFTIEDGITIPGFTVRQLSDWEPLGNDRIGTIYYDRNKYDITFNYNDGLSFATRPGIPYQNDISGQAPSDMTQGVTTIVFNGVTHTFEGWYDNQGLGGSPYNFIGKSMPPNHLNFYAKWSPEKHVVRFHANQNEGSEVVNTAYVPHNSPIPATEVPTHNELNFLGWYTYIGGNFVKFDLSTAIQSNLDLYPVWSSDDFKVTYNLNGGIGTAPVDSNKYLVNSQAVVLPIPTDVNPPTGKVFLGWKIGNTGQMYHPNDKITITGHIELFAQWGNINESTKIVYNGNGGLFNGSEIIERTVPNNVNHSIEGNTFVRNGYVFVGWNTKADGSGTSYQSGDKIMIDKINENTENILYAMWIVSKVDVKATKIWSGGHAVNHTVVTIELYRKIAGGVEALVNVSPSINPPGGTSGEFVYTWSNVDKYDSLGNLYIYSVKEPVVPNSYTAVVTGSGYNFTITNTYHNIKNVEAKKYWYGVSSPSDKPAIWFTLYRTTASGTNERVPGLNPVSVPPGNDSVHWQNLIGSDPQGYDYTFYVKETDAYGNDFTPPGFEKVETGLSVYNYKGSRTISFTANKDWTNVNDMYKTPINVQLKRDGENLGSQIELNADNGWSYTWTNLEKYKNQTEMYVYTVEENTSDLHPYVTLDTIVYSEYNTTSVSKTATIKNKFAVPMNGEATATKEWKNGPTPRPTVWFKLYRNIAGGPIEPVPEAVIKELPNGTTTVKWTNLAKTNPLGIPYIFSVREVDADGNDFTPENYTKVEQGLIVTNTYASPPTDEDIVGTKLWVGGPSEKPEVEFELWRKNGTAGEGEKVVDATVVADGKVNFGKQDKTDANGVEYDYYVIEPETPENYTKVEQGLTVTNTYKIPTDGNAKATKVWVNGPTPRPTVWFKLYRQVDGGLVEEVPVVQAPIKELADGTTTAEWTGLEQTDINGKPYTFSVKEVNAAGEDFTPANYSKAENGLTVTNTYASPTDGRLDFTKKWVGDETVTRPTMVLELWRKTDAVDEKVPGADTIEVDGNITTASWTALTETDEDGNPYTFYVKESFKVDKPSNANWILGEYNFSNNSITNSVVTGNDKNGKLEIEKILKNELEEPSSSDMRLFADPIEFTIVVTDEYGNETSVQIKAGQTVLLEGLYFGEYTIEETVTHGYVPSYDPETLTVYKNATNIARFKVTNSRIGGDEDPNEVKITVEKVWEGGKKPDVVIELWRKGIDLEDNEIVEKVGAFTANASITSKTFEKLAKHDPSGREFEYYVLEPNVPANYTAEIEGFTVTNTYASPTDGKLDFTKKWVGDETVTRPTMVLELWRKTDAVDEKVPGADTIEVDGNITTASWTALTETDEDGNPYTFYVKESFKVDKPSNANWILGEYNFDNNTITNKVVTGDDKNGKLEIVKILKNELDLNDMLLQMRGAPIEFTVVVTDEYGNETSVQIKAGETVTVDNLYFGEYTIEETVTHGYVPSYDPETLTVYKNATNIPKFVVTNSRIGGDEDPNEVKITVEKVWKGGTKPDVTLELWRKGIDLEDNEIVEKVGEYEATTAAPSKMFDKLAKHDPSGREFEYYVIEPNVPENYTAEIEGFTVINTYVPPYTDEDVIGIKQWINSPSSKPDVKFELWRKIGAEGKGELVVGATLVVNDSVNFGKQLKTDMNGDEYTYYVLEPEVPANYSKFESGLTVVNTYIKPNDGWVDAVKLWSGGNSPRPTIWFKLFRNIEGGEPEAVPGQTLRELADGETRAKWILLETEDAFGNKYEFSVREVDADGNDFTPENYTKSEYGLIVKNTYTGSQADGEVIGEKTWVNGPIVKPTIWFKLYRQVEGGEPEAVPGVEIKELADGTTSVKWTGLETHDAEGKEYRFFVKEVNADGEDFVPENYTKSEAGMKVINTYTEKPTPDPDPDPDPKPDPDDPEKPKPQDPKPGPEKPKPVKPKDDKPKLPKTGSEAAIALYGGIALVGVGGAGLLLRRKKKK